MLVSAHRGGPAGDDDRENSAAALAAATALGCDFVELDVQACRDGVHVVHHDDAVTTGDGRRVPVWSLTLAELTAVAGPPLLLDDALAALRGRAGAHLDLKVLAEPAAGPQARREREVALVAHVVAVLGADAVVVTGLRDGSVAAVRAWAREHCPPLRVGLGLGGDITGLGPVRLVRQGLGEVFPGRRLRRTDATLVVCEKSLARWWIARWAHRRGLPLLVWTVDGERALRRWVRDPRLWMLTTNYPARALAARGDRAHRPRDDDGAPSAGPAGGAPVGARLRRRR